MIELLKSKNLDAADLRDICVIEQIEYKQTCSRRLGDIDLNKTVEWMGFDCLIGQVGESGV